MFNGDCSESLEYIIGTAIIFKDDVICWIKQTDLDSVVYLNSVSEEIRNIDMVVWKFNEIWCCDEYMEI